MSQALLVINSGSSSVKFAVYDVACDAAFDSTLTRIANGRIEGIGSAPRLLAWGQDGAPLEDKPIAVSADPVLGREDAFKQLFERLKRYAAGRTLLAAGHRVVHGGEKFTRPALVTPEVLAQLDGYIPLAPLHEPHNLSSIRAISSLLPELPQVACFDTGFHTTQPWVAQAYALPRHITEAGVKRYGFHGLSYEYIASVLPVHFGAAADGRVVVAHLGNGASLCAMKNRQSIASTMGFTALDGLMMGTRCGALDPGVVLYLLKQLHMGADQVSDLLYSRSGLLGVSGISSDMQVLLASSEPRALEAVDLFVHRIVCEIGSLAAAMGGVDALVFTAGIGENAAPIRARICDGCAWLGAVLDDRNNRDGRMLIHAAHSALLLAVVPTDEEEMIATHTLRLLR